MYTKSRRRAACRAAMHRTKLWVAILLVLCAVRALAGQAGRASPGTAPGEDWPRWRGPRGDGTWRAPKLPPKWPDRGLRTVWRQPIGGGYAGVVAVSGRVYTTDRHTTPPEAERVLCFDATSGKPVWSHSYAVRYGDLDYGNGPRAAPTVVEGGVFTLGAVGHLHALDATTGRILWSKDLVREYAARTPTWGFAASPVVFEGLVIVHAGIEPAGSFIAFDRRTGQERWRSLSDKAGYATPIVIGQAGAPLLIGWTPEHVCGLEPRTGKLLWKIPYAVTYGVSIATPIHQDGIVLVSGYWEGTKAIRLGTSAGVAKLLWEESRQLRGLMSQPLARDGYVYLLDKQFGLTCCELKTGRKLWDDDNRMTPKGRNPQASLVWLGDGDRAIVLNSDGELILARLNPRRYEEQSRTKIIGETWAHPAYAGTSVYARSDTELVCVSLVD